MASKRRKFIGIPRKPFEVPVAAFILQEVQWIMTMAAMHDAYLLSYAWFLLLDVSRAARYGFQDE